MADGEILAELILEGDEEFQQGMQEATQGVTEVGESSMGATQGTDQFSESLVDLDAAGMAAGGALAAVGTGMQEVMDSTQAMREEMGRAAVGTEMTSQEMTNLATNVSNATFPIEDASATMDALARQGVESRDRMAELSTEFDTLADAVGTDAATAAEDGARAMRAFGNDLDDISEKQDVFTYVTRNTTLGFEQFTGSIERMAPELQEMGMSMEDTAATIAALEEQGISGRQAIREIRQATNAAEGDQEAFRQELGLSEDQVQAHTEAMSNADGITQEYADAANESLSPMDEMRNRFNELKLQAGEVLQPLGAMAPVMQTAGIAMMTFSTINWSQVVPSLQAVYGSLIPILGPLAALGLAAGALYVAWDNNFLGIKDTTDQVLQTIRPWLQLLRDDFGQTVQHWVNVGSDALAFIEGLWSDHRDTVMMVVGPFLSALQLIFEQVMDYIITVIRAGLAVLRGDFEGAADMIIGYFERSVGRFRDAGRALIEAFVDGIEAAAGGVGDAVEGAVDEARSYLPSSPAEQGPLSDIDEAGEALPGTVADGALANSGALTSATEQVAAQARQALTPNQEDAEEAGEQTGEQMAQGARDAMLTEQQERELGLTEQSSQYTGNGRYSAQDREAVAPEMGASSASDTSTTSYSGSGSTGSVGGGTTVEVDARMMEGAVQLSGITWSEALDRVRDIIDERIGNLERSIRRRLPNS